jgi:hypothetical protein
MKRHIYILIFGLTLGLIACNSSADKQAKNENKSVSVDSIKKTETQNETASVKDLREDCVRGQAEPIIKKTVFPNTKFILQPDSLTAIETVNFDNGDKVTIRNWGCEYYVLTFRFETSRFQADTKAMKYWYVTTYRILNEMQKGIDAPVDIEKGLQALNRHISKNVFDLKLQTEIDFAGDEIREFITVEQIEKLTDNKFAITVSFTTGPL